MCVHFIVLTLTSRNAISDREVEGEVSVQQWRTILVDNIPGSNAPEMTQPSLFDQGKGEGGENMDAIYYKQETRVVFQHFILLQPSS